MLFRMGTIVRAPHTRCLTLTFEIIALFRNYIDFPYCFSSLFLNILHNKVFFNYHLYQYELKVQVSMSYCIGACITAIIISLSIAFKAKAVNIIVWAGYINWILWISKAQSVSQLSYDQWTLKRNLGEIV